MGPHINFNEKDLCNECSIASLKDMRHTYLLLFMFKQKEKESLLKKLLDIQCFGIINQIMKKHVRM